jgi:branched-chain amino acid transport system substrate-binding protein
VTSPSRLRWRVSFSLAVACSLVAAGGCTSNEPASQQPPSVSGTPGATPGLIPSPSVAPGASPITFEVVADLRPGSSSRPYLDGMQLAVDEIDGLGGVGGRPLVLSIRDHGGDPDLATSLVGDALDEDAPAILYVGTGPALTPLRPRFERLGTPVVLLSGDLYTSRGLFRQVFQTTIPWKWQAKVVGRYLVLDRKARRIAFVGEGPEARAAAAAMREALEYWGGTLWKAIINPGGGSLDAVRGADAVVGFGSPEDSTTIVSALKRFDDPPRIVGSASFLDVDLGTLGAPPGTTACYTYTWAGWAKPIARVGRFTSNVQSALGRPPIGLEQEGYDAVRTLALALARTNGKTGPALVRALESVHDRTFSSFPVDLGPDDHTFLPRDELGLFAVAGPNERLDPWQQPGSSPWRALMRAFTYDGTKTDILDRDKRVFFPFWRKDRPSPEYWRSRYGIVSKPGGDPLH